MDPRGLPVIDKAVLGRHFGNRVDDKNCKLHTSYSENTGWCWKIEILLFWVTSHNVHTPIPKLLSRGCSPVKLILAKGVVQFLMVGSNSKVKIPRVTLQLQGRSRKHLSDVPGNLCSYTVNGYFAVLCLHSYKSCYLEQVMSLDFSCQVQSWM